MNSKLFSRVRVKNPPLRLLPSAFVKLESSCVSAQMGSSDEEAPSPELGASSSKAPVTPLPGTPDDDSEPEDQVRASMESSSHEETSEEEDDDEPVQAKRTFKKDTRVWNLTVRYSKVDHDAEDIRSAHSTVRVRIVAQQVRKDNFSCRNR
jgi:hypothetical protein